MLIYGLEVSMALIDSNKTCQPQLCVRESVFICCAPAILAYSRPSAHPTAVKLSPLSHTYLLHSCAAREHLRFRRLFGARPIVQLVKGGGENSAVQTCSTRVREEAGPGTTTREPEQAPTTLPAETLQETVECTGLLKSVGAPCLLLWPTRNLPSPPPRPRSKRMPRA